MAALAKQLSPINVSDEVDIITFLNFVRHVPKCNILIIDEEMNRQRRK